MTHPEDVITECVDGAKTLMKAWLKSGASEELLRMDAIEANVDAWIRWCELGAYEAAIEVLTEMGARRAGTCPRCQMARERDKKTVRVRTKRLVLMVDVFRYRCRPCGTASTPVREWLGIESGQTTGGFDRAASVLATELSFGATAT